MKSKYLSDRNKLLNLSYRHAKKYPEEIPNQYDLAIVDLYTEAKKHGIVLPEHGHFTKDHKSLKLDKHEK